MRAGKEPVKCYVAALRNQKIDSILECHGFAKGVISFAIPDYGILFRCRTEGSLIDLEFVALFALLEFLKTRLKDEKLNNILILSSNPEFIFSFAGNSGHLEPGTARRRLLDEFASMAKLAVRYIKGVENKALVSPADCPSMPIDQNISLKPSTGDSEKSEFKPFQRGVEF